MTVRYTSNVAHLRMQHRKARRKAIAAGAEHILGASNATVPLEEGTLERSGTVTVDDGGHEAAVSYDTVYAARQHEELTWQHDPGRRAKFLELALIEDGDTALALMAARYRREMGT